MVDLEVQVQAFTVDELKAVEIHVGSRCGASELEAFPVASPLPLLAKLDQVEGGPTYYLEMIHPDDGTRVEDDRPDGWVRYALFGYDLERGVVLRGRLRGIWLDRRPDQAEVARRFDEFLREPLPLGI